MEADWEAEIGAGAPVIDGSWPGFVDLRRAPKRIVEIEEAHRFAPLAEALLRLNGARSPLWTVKCDLWTPEHLDPEEMEAGPQESAQGLACYIDVLPASSLVFARFEQAESWARSAVSRIRNRPCRCCRADLVIRAAVTVEREGFGITIYVQACGADAVAATGHLTAALIEVIEAIIAPAPQDISA